jgi:diaminopimelate epimerase
MKFTKMEGIGNDYVYVNGFETEVDDRPEVARKVSDRHFGIGSDGLILLLPSDVADLKMEMYNADGSLSEMCGNGLRCVGFYAFKYGIVSDRSMTVETGAGVLPVELTGVEGQHRATVRIELGEPRLDRHEIPMDGEPGIVANEPIEVDGETLRITAVSMGNPHAVVYVPDTGSYPVERFGPALENHPSFPNRVNVEFVSITSRREVVQRTWERGSGETMACGTGAAAVTVAGIVNNVTDSPLKVHLTGGDLLVEWDGRGPVYQTGAATEVFQGEWLL